MYDLGIIGGMGPEATAEIFRRIVLLTVADCDQAHMKICILNKPQIPDRTEYLINNGKSPLPIIIEGINELKSLSTRFFIIPCNTSHIFSSEFYKSEDIVFIDMIKTTKNYLREQFKDDKICILGTTGTVSAKVYDREFNSDEINIIYPNRLLQSEVMNIILSVKANSNTIIHNRERLIEVMRKVLIENGECTFVIACTELSVIMSDLTIEGIKFIDALELLAINAILKCGYKVNIEKTNITISSVS